MFAPVDLAVRQAGSASGTTGRVIDAAEREIDPRGSRDGETLASCVIPIRKTIFYWRCWLEDHGIRQPFKQAHREVFT